MPPPALVEVVEDLRDVPILNVLARLDLDENLAVDDEVGLKDADHDAVKADFHLAFLDYVEVHFTQYDRERPPIDLLGVAMSELPVHLIERGNDSVRELGVRKSHRTDKGKERSAPIF